MKRAIILTLLFTSFIRVNAQSADDILNWIQIQISTNEISDDDLFQHSNKLTISNGTLIVELELKPFSKGFYSTLYAKDYIPIKNITNVTFKNLGSTTHMMIYTNTSFKQTIQSKGSPTQTKYVHKAEIVLSKSINDNNLPNRLRNAFKDLVKRNGGEIKKDLY